jgi:DNA-binding transcriptional LysR family regulator
MLSLDRLRTLHAVAAYGSVRAAADALHVTTSAVSQQVGKLEQEVGQCLLERSGRGVRLTDAAELLVRHAGRILSLVEEAEVDLEARRGAVVGRLTIGAFATAARGLGPGALCWLGGRHAGLEVELSELEPSEALPLVSRGDLDLAVVQDWFNAPLVVPGGLVKSPLLDDVADVALPAHHPLACRDVVGLAELGGEPWVNWARGSICHDWLLYTLRSLGSEPRVAHVAGEHQTQLALVAAGLGVCVSPRLGRGPLPEGVRAVPVTPALRRHIYAVWRADAARRPAIRVAVEALRAASGAPPAPKRAAKRPGAGRVAP